MKMIVTFWTVLLATVAALAGNGVQTVSSIHPANHQPLKFSYQATAAADGKVALTFKFEPKAGYAINITPKPKLDLVRGAQSVLTSQMVPPNVGKEGDSQYYGSIAPVTVTVDRAKGLEARFTYFFCSKADGFCARKIEKLAVQLP